MIRGRRWMIWDDNPSLYSILSPKNRVVISRKVIFSAKEKSCDNKSADKDSVDKGNERDNIDDSYEYMSSFFHRSDSGISYSSAGSGYHTESNIDNSNDNEESVFSSSNSEDDYGYGNDG